MSRTLQRLESTQRIFCCAAAGVASPSLEDSAMSFSEQSDTPLVNQNHVQPDPSVDIHPRSESSKELLNPTEDMDREIPPREDSDSGSGSELNSESCSDSGSQDGSISELETPLEESLFSLWRKLHLIV